MRESDIIEGIPIHKQGVGYAPAGILLGCCLPCAAWALDILVRHLAFNWAAVVTIHRANPLHYILDSVPLVCGLIFFVGGSSRKHLRQHKVELERLAAERAAALQQAREAHEQLQVHQEFLRSVLDTDPNFVFVKNPEGRFVLVNKALADAYNTTVGEMIGKSDADFDLDEEHVAAYLEADRRMIASGEQVFVAEEIFAAAKAHTQWVQTVKRPIRVPGSSEVHVLGIATDITDRKETVAAIRRSEQQLQAANERLTEGTALLQEQIERINDQTVRLELQKAELEAMNARLEMLATTDGLTGLKNHRTFQERLRAEVKRAERHESTLSVLLLDVDEFKNFNDTFGHPAGDTVLQKVAEVLQGASRETDLVARYGGEEFAVILPETDEAGARVAAEGFRRAIEAVLWIVNPVTVSVGMATWSAVECDAAVLVKQADSALYRSKQSGRNCVTHCADAVNSSTASDDKLKQCAQMVRQRLDLQEDTLAGVSSSISVHLLRVYDGTVDSWAKILYRRDEGSTSRSGRVAETMMRLMRRAGMNDEEILYAKWGALLHDIGNLGIPDSILYKAEPRTREESDLVKRHPEIAYEMLSPIPFLEPALAIPHAHHERWDGTGYPQGLQGDSIPLAARMFSVVEAYDTLMDAAKDGMARTELDAIDYLRRQAGHEFDPRAVNAFLAMLAEEKIHNRLILLSAA